MANIYTPSGNPFYGDAAASAAISGEFRRIADALNAIQFPPVNVAGNAEKALVVNPAGTEYTFTAGALELTGDFRVKGSKDLTFTLSSDVVIVAPPVNGTMALTSDISVANVATLYALPAGYRPASIMLLGYWTPGDRGAGPLFWDANSTTSANGGTVFQMSDGRYKRLYPGNRIYAEWFGCTGDVGQDATTYMAQAMGVLNTDGGILGFGWGFYVFSSLPEMTKIGAILEGVGEDGTFLCHSGATGDTLKMSGAFCSVRNLTFQPTVWKNSGYEIDMTGSYRGSVLHCLFQFHNNGIKLPRSATCNVESCTFLYSHGSINIDFSATTSGDAATGLDLSKIVFNNAQPVTELTYSAWGYGKAFLNGQYTYVDDWVWQCTQSGTTALSGILAPDQSNTINWILNSVTHGSAQFRALYRTNLVHIYQGSYCSSITGNAVRALNGAYGYFMADQVNLTGSAPNWSMWDDLETDHSFFAGVAADAGSGITLGSNCWIGSVLNGSGIVTLTAFKGPIILSGVRVAGNSQTGFLMQAGRDFLVDHCTFAGNGTSSIGTYNDITIAAGISYGSIHDNHFGAEGSDNFGGNISFSGVFIAVGASSNITVKDNQGRLFTSGFTVVDGATGSNVVVTDNIGYNPVAMTNPSAAASPTTITAGHAPETITLRSGAVSSVTVDGNTIFTASPCTVVLPANKSLVITHAGAPQVWRIPH